MHVVLFYYYSRSTEDHSNEAVVGPFLELELARDLLRQKGYRPMVHDPKEPQPPTPDLVWCVGEHTRFYDCDAHQWAEIIEVTSPERFLAPQPPPTDIHY